MKKKVGPKIKFWKVMKICAVQGMVAMVFCGMALAHTNFAQVLDRRISLSLKDVSFEEALDQLEAVTDVRFFLVLTSWISEIKFL